jgi:uncharacterized protein (TIGR03435 family)
MRLALLALPLFTTATAQMPITAAIIDHPAAIEEVTITPYVGAPGTGHLEIHGDTLSGTGVSLTTLLYKAYDLPPTVIFGLTPEQTTASYNINAKIVAPDAPNADTAAARSYMLQTLLSKHFGVKAHIETRALAVLQLAVAPGGTTLHASPMNKDPAFTADSTRLAAHDFTLSDVAREVSTKLQTTVIDGTGLTGRYEVDIHWPHTAPVPERLGEETQLTPGSMGSSQQAIAAAIQQQLGLKIESTTASVKTLVVDQVELPPS